MRDDVLIFIGLVVVIFIIGVVAYYSLSPTRPVMINETLELCEIENPSYNAAEECQKFIDFKYRDKECTFDLGPVTYIALGSCRDCRIACK